MNDIWLTIEFLDCIFFPTPYNEALAKKQVVLTLFSKFGYFSYSRLFRLLSVSHANTVVVLNAMDSDCVDFWKSKSICSFPLAFYSLDLCI